MKMPASSKHFKRSKRFSDFPWTTERYRKLLQEITEAEIDVTAETCKSNLEIQLNHRI
ncbi:5954_t:CDS:2 [Entrophospora sp. SA101]|nr:5954_t:CDS:2 [Entrophospora sp. SA101]